MCNSPSCNHLDDDLSDLLGPVDEAAAFARSVLAPAKITSAVTFEEKCDKCRGTGRFVGYTGRVLGDCFACKGAGVRRYKTSSEQRAKAADQRDAAKARAAATVAEQAQAWIDTHAEENAMLLKASTRGFEFASDMLITLAKYGHFTEKQQAAITRMHAKQVEREAQWAQEAAQRAASAVAIDIGRIATALSTAARNGLKWPKLRLAGFQFSPAGANSRNPGAIYVKDGEAYLGKISEGRFQRSRDCDADREQAILAAAADPEAAATAYGHQTGVCACCGRELTNAESVERGIGPICAEKWGW